MNKKYVINIGRQLGSGGRLIGEMLAKQLDIAFYDKELIQIASRESGLGKEFFEKADEKSSFNMLGSFLGWFTNPGDEGYLDNYLRNESLFKIQSDVIRELAEKHSCIFVGRCADYILRDYPLTLNVFISANLEDRMQRVAEQEQITLEKAQEIIERTDKQRAGYYNYYSNKVWGMATSYDLCVNSSLLGIDDTAAFIRAFAEKRLRTNEI